LPVGVDYRAKSGAELQKNPALDRDPKTGAELPIAIAKSSDMKEQTFCSKRADKWIRGIAGIRRGFEGIQGRWHRI